jgi:hypothetical protein
MRRVLFDLSLTTSVYNFLIVHFSVSIIFASTIFANMYIVHEVIV